MSADIVLKILLFGDSDVDKTKFLNRYVGDCFNATHLQTIGVDFKTKTINMKDMKICLQIWDTAGQDRFRTITQSYLRGAAGAILIYDITNKESFESLKNNYIKMVESSPEDIKYIIVGNKMDLENARDISREEVKAFCNGKNIKEFEVSSELNINIDLCFNTLVELIIGNKSKDEFLKKKGNNLKRDKCICF